MVVGAVFNSLHLKEQCPQYPQPRQMYLHLPFVIFSINVVFAQLTQRQTSNQTCLAECAVAINQTASCATSPDPYCGCSDFIAVAPSCNDCLSSNNVTLLGFINTTYIDFIFAACKCQLDSCRDLILVEKQCAIANASDATCACAATLKDSPDCYPCLMQNSNGDQLVAQGLDARVAFCQAATNSSPTATPSGSASASQSALPTFTSESSILSAFSKIISFGIGIVAMATLFGI